MRLVLEYCDRGCLHDALAQDAFMNTRGLNFQAILDTALDVTRAMVHLHMADVLHGDLKVGGCPAPCLHLRALFCYGGSCQPPPICLPGMPSDMI